MKNPIEPYKVYTVPEAAIELGTSEETLNKLCKKNAIIARHIGKGYKILGENLLRYLREGEKNDI